jgi:hypothetical protein
MKFTIVASLAAMAMATEQAFVLPDSKPKPTKDEMWTNDRIKDYVAKNHGGYEWQAFEKKQLLTETSRQAYVGTVITGLVSDWQSSLKQLPNVCTPGIQCRKEIND